MAKQKESIRKELVDKINNAVDLPVLTEEQEEVLINILLSIITAKIQDAL